jgi:hypothetical protein
MGGSSTMAVGLTNLTHIMNIYLGWDQANAIEYRNNGAIVGTNTSTTGVATYTTGDIIGVWFKPDGSVSFYKNGTLQANRTDVPTGSLYPTATIGSSTDQLTANFGATAFNSLPATAIAWNTNAAVPNVGASAGTNTATAVGAQLQAGVGSSAGANTSAAVGAWLQSGVGSAAGTDTATATGSNLQAGVGASAGSNTAAATATWLQSGVGNAQGTNTATGFYSAVPSTATSAGSNTSLMVRLRLQTSILTLTLALADIPVSARVPAKATSIPTSMTTLPSSMSGRSSLERVRQLAATSPRRSARLSSSFRQFIRHLHLFRSKCGIRHKNIIGYRPRGLPEFTDMGLN